MFQTIDKASINKRCCRAIIAIVCPFILMLSNGYCNKAVNLKLFDTVVTKDILMGKDVQMNRFALEINEERNVRSYLFEFQFKKTDPIQHYICAISVARAGAFIDPKLYEADYNRLKNEYMKANPGRWMQQLRLDFPEIGRRAQYGHIAAGPGGAAFDLSMTTSDGMHDVKILISNLMPESVEGPDLDIEKIAKAISDRYNLAANVK